MLLKLKTDYRRLGRGEWSWFRAVYSWFALPGFRAVAYYRAARGLHSVGAGIAARLLSARCVKSTGADISPEAEIGPGLLIPHPVGVVIGCGAIVGRDCTILQGVTLGEKLSGRDGGKYPRIGDAVTLCAGAKILGDLEVRDKAVVGANAVVIRSVAPGDCVVGIPARALRVSEHSDGE